jgi:hypothetical protein
MLRRSKIFIVTVAKTCDQLRRSGIKSGFTGWNTPLLGADGDLDAGSYKDLAPTEHDLGLPDAQLQRRAGTPVLARQTSENGLETGQSPASGGIAPHVPHRFRAGGISR